MKAAGSVMLRLWHGLGLLQMVGFQGESPADRLPGQPCARWREKQESPGVQEERERERGRVVLNSPIWTPPTGGWSNQSVCMGRSPAHVHGFYPRYTFM